jgi:hypothetical protein
MTNSNTVLVGKHEGKSPPSLLSVQAVPALMDNYVPGDSSQSESLFPISAML